MAKGTRSIKVSDAVYAALMQRQLDALKRDGRKPSFDEVLAELLGETKRRAPRTAA